jgi:hypothetical protein
MVDGCGVAVRAVWGIVLRMDATWRCERVRRIALRMKCDIAVYFHAEFFHAKERYVHAQLFNDIR